MYALTLSLSEFLVSSSGNIKPQRGLSMGWLSLVLGGLAALVGLTERADADSCHGIPEDQCGFYCGVNNNCPPTYLEFGWACHLTYPNHYCDDTFQSCGC